MVAAVIENPNLPVLSISAVAEILNIHPRTLRIYDDEGILIPGRSPKNRRKYSLKDVERGKLINFMTRDIGINLAGIKIIQGLLFKDGIRDPKEQLNVLKAILHASGVTNETLADNRIKLSRRGRKKSIKG